MPRSRRWRGIWHDSLFPERDSRWLLRARFFAALRMTGPKAFSGTCSRAIPKIGYRAENAHFWKLAVILSVVEAVAYDEGIGDGVAHVVGAYRASAARGVVVQGNETQALGAVGLE